MKSPLALLLAFLLLLGACATKTKVSSVEFSRYVAGFTSGKVDLDQEILIELTPAVLDSALFDVRDTAFLQKNIKISPSVSGRFYWKNSRTIAFRPTARFKEGTTYQVSLQLDRFTKVAPRFNTFYSLFETERQKFDVNTAGLYTYNDYDIEWQYYELHVSTNADIGKDEVQHCFSATGEGRALKVRCVRDEPRRYTIYIDSIQRKERPTELKVSWNTRSLGGNLKESKDIKVSSLGSYTVTGMTVEDDGDQKVRITFSDPILPAQNFDGLITVEDARSKQVSAEGNTVTLFFPERLEGRKQIKVMKGLQNFRGYKMDSSASGYVVFAGPRPAIRAEGKGCILPNSQGLLFPFQSIGLHSVDVRIIKIKEQNMHQFLQVNELDGDDGLTRVGRIVVEKTIRLVNDTITPQNQWSTHILDLGKLIQPEPGSLYRVCIRYKKAYTYLPCRNDAADQDSEYLYDVEATEAEDPVWSEQSWHGGGFDGYNTWSNSGREPCDDYYYQSGAICRNILASDIGVAYREEQNRTARIVTTNLLDAGPLAGAEVVLYNYTRDKIASGTTDAQGFLSLSLSEKPFLLVAARGKQRAYLKLTNRNCLSTSRFQVEGSDQANGMKGFLYAERGVWRPGDSVFLHFVLDDRSHPIPDKHPLQFSLFDPNGNEILSRTVTQHTGHIYPLYFRTANNAPMGSYTAKVTVGNASFSQNILLEYIVPNRMKLLSNVDGRLLTPADSQIGLQVSWLNGATGRGLKTQATVSFRPAPYFFSKFPDYHFIAPYNEGFRGSFELRDTFTDHSGRAVFRHPGLRIQPAPGILHVSYVFKAFEQGGGFSIDRSESNLSVYDSYVGIKVPSGKNYSGSLDYNKSHVFSYVVADRNQQQVAGHHLQLSIYELQRTRWYEADPYDISSFRTHTAKICVKDTQWIAATGAGSFTYGNLDKKYGRYVFILKDLASGHETGAVVVFDDPYWDRYSSDEADNEGMIQISASKKSYKVGEEVQLNIPAPENAHVLISVTSDARVLQEFWVQGPAIKKPVSFIVTTAMAPGMYVHATVLQPHHYTRDGAPIRQYGIIPLQVEDPALRLNPVIAMKDEIRPETMASVSISEKDGKAMNYSLVLVDEGLLDLTHFKTPDIWKEMNAQRSLKIRTWDMFNDVIGAYAGKIQHVFAIGGDGAYDESGSGKANRFRPAIINLGLFRLEAGARKQHNFSIPNYCGRMKAIVVAYDEGRSGSASREFGVRKPLMVLTGAPRTMSASEQYQVPVTVFNTDKKARKVQVTMNVSGLQSFHYNHTLPATFSGDGDLVVNFPLKVPEETGVLRMEVTVSDGAEQSKELLEIQVKPTQPAINHQQLVPVASGATITLDLRPKGIQGSYQASLSLNSELNIDFSGKLGYLISYPHGCAEQTTSAAFAQLFLNDVKDLSPAEAAEVKVHVESVLNRLNRYQTAGGGFSYWPYQYETSEFISIYILHFLHEAKKKGFEPSKYLLDNAVAYQKKQAGQYERAETSSYEGAARQLEQAYRLYVLAEMGMPDIAAMNNLRESARGSDLTPALLAKAYQLAGKTEIARQLAFPIQGHILKQPPTGIHDAMGNQSLLLLALRDNGNSITCNALAKDLREQLTKDWNSTLSTSLALVALSKYYGKDVQGAGTYSLNGRKGRLAKLCQAIDTRTDNGRMAFRNESDRSMYLVLNERYASMDNRNRLINNGMKLQISYLDGSNRAVDPANLSQGANFRACIRVSNLTNEKMENVALDYYIANGWQMISNRYTDDEALGKSAATDFRNMQDDRLNLFFSLAGKETKVFYVQLNASYKGRFFIPLAQCYPMYNEHYKAQVDGQWVNVQ